MPERLGVAVEPRILCLAPGASGVLRVRIKNNDSVADEYAITVVGIDPHWLNVAPTRITLPPGGQATADLFVALPARPAPPTGRLILGVRVASLNGLPPASRVEECQIDVALLERAEMMVKPTIARGGRSGRFSVDVVNEGNGSIQLQFHGADPEGIVAFAFSPQRVELAARARACVRLKVAAPRPWSGAEPRRVFVVHTTGAAGVPEQTATFIQRTRASTALLWLAAVLSAIALYALTLLLVDVFRPADPTMPPAQPEPQLSLR